MNNGLFKLFLYIFLTNAITLTFQLNLQSASLRAEEMYSIDQE